jgi:metal-dependent amidase/aminoacylase/carboxypeptidase family protein
MIVASTGVGLHGQQLKNSKPPYKMLLRQRPLTIKNCRVSIQPIFQLITSSPFSSTSSKHEPSTAQVKHLTVIGAGLMGSGIAQVAAQAGISVTVHGMNQEICKESNAIINQSLKRIAKKKFSEDHHQATQFIQSVNNNLKFATEIKSAVDTQKTDLIIEAIVEKIEIKQELFKTLDGLIENPETIFTSNTSSLKIGDISQAVSAQRMKHFAGLHFFKLGFYKLTSNVYFDQSSDRLVLFFCFNHKTVQFLK